MITLTLSAPAVSSILIILLISTYGLSSSFHSFDTFALGPYSSTFWIKFNLVSKWRIQHKTIKVMLMLKIIAAILSNQIAHPIWFHLLPLHLLRTSSSHSLHCSHISTKRHQAQPKHMRLCWQTSQYWRTKTVISSIIKISLTNLSAILRTLLNSYTKTIVKTPNWHMFIPRAQSYYFLNWWKGLIYLLSCISLIPKPLITVGLVMVLSCTRVAQTYSPKKYQDKCMWINFCGY